MTGQDRGPEGRQPDRADRDLVLAKLRQVFPGRNPGALLGTLDQYGASPAERETHRVHLAILKLCDEAETPDLEGLVEAAKQDYRDVVAWAETPALMRAGPDIDADRRAELGERDRRQYEAWLNNK